MDEQLTREQVQTLFGKIEIFEDHLLPDHLWMLVTHKQVAVFNTQTGNIHVVNRTITGILRNMRELGNKDG